MSDELPLDFRPVGLLPARVPKRWRDYWVKLGEEAHHRYRAAVELKCVECCAWDRVEAKACDIVTCPLWALNRRIFGRDGEEDGESREGTET